MDAAGFVYVYGRRDSAFCPGGAEPVYPAEIENVLAEDPRVLACAVVLRSSDGAITAHIHAHAADVAEQETLEASLRELAASRLPEGRRPAKYFFWPKGLPLNECGKTARKELENY